MSQSPEWRTTARVVRRLGFGATGAEVDAALATGIDAYVAGVLSASPATDPGVKATPPPRFATIATLGRAASTTQRKAVNTERSGQLAELTVWWLHRMVAVHRPAGEKLTFLWHNHFATSAAKVADAPSMLGQNEKLRTMGLGGFRPLAYAMLTDPAMLRWLDGASNVKSSPNENLSREFMELFALGHGNGYTETDVREGARALTGWRPTRTGGAVLKTSAHDTGTKTVLGVTGDLDAAGFCDAVLGHPGSAGYVTSRMWQQLASDTPPDAATSSRLIAAYGGDRNLRALTTAVLTDPSFAGARSVVSPVEWVVGAMRALTPIVDHRRLTAAASTLRTLGQLPFYPPSVGGWPAGQAWLSTAGAETRWTTAMRLAATAQNPTIVDAPPTDRIDAAAHLLGVGAFSDRTAAVLRPTTRDPVTLTAIALNSPEYLTS